MIAVGVKFGKKEEFGFQREYPFGFNIGVGAVCLTAELICLAEFVRRWIETRLQGKRWSRRRKFVALIHFSELVTQACNLCAFLISNSFIRHGTCTWFHPIVYWCNFIQWTCWNTIFFLQLVVAHGSDPIIDDWFWRHFAKWVLSTKDLKTRQIVMDASWMIHIPKMFVWAVFEALVIVISIHFQSLNFESHVVSTDGFTDCRFFNYSCTVDAFSIGLTCAIFGMWVLYLVLWALSLYRAIKGLQRIPYNNFKMANLNVRMQVRTRATGNTMFLLTVCLLWFGNPSSCSSFIFTIPGFADLHIVETSLAVALAYFYMPKTPILENSILQVWLQEFAWTEKDVSKKLKTRAAKLPENPALASEPIFCFELAIRLFYWSCLVYTYEEATSDEKVAERGDGETKEKQTDNRQTANERADQHTADTNAGKLPGGLDFDIKTAMDLFGLEHVKVIREPADDTKVLVGWSASTVVLAFRGTNSFTNAKRDAQVWRTKYPHGLGNWRPGSAPRVHAGFLTTWQKNGLSERLVQRLCQILSTRRDCPGGVKIYITGHSLGGALATLAAFDLVRGCKSSDHGPATDPICYTFGAPRLGNHAFANLYNTTVPNTWHVINDQDIVARGGKLWFLYKRPGQRVIINATGDVIVRPSYTEVTMQQTPFASRLQHHYLAAYKKSLLSVLIGQFGDKKLHGGVQGVIKLLRACHLEDVLQVDGAERDKLQKMAGGRMQGVPIAGRIMDIGSVGADQVRGVLSGGEKRSNHEHGDPRKLQEQTTRSHHRQPSRDDTSGWVVGTEFDDIKLQQSNPHQSHHGHNNIPDGTSSAPDMSTSSPRVSSASRLHTVLDINEDTGQQEEGPEDDRGLPGPRSDDQPRRSMGSLAQERDDESAEEEGSESDGRPDDPPDEESLMAQLQRLDHEGKLRNLGSTHASEGNSMALDMAARETEVMITTRSPNFTYLDSGAFGVPPLPFTILKAWLLQQISVMRDLEIRGLSHNDIKPKGTWIGHRSKAPPIVTLLYSPPEYFQGMLETVYPDADPQDLKMMRIVLRQLVHEDPDKRVGGVHGMTFVQLEQQLRDDCHW
ncbi:hypothetical protein WJX84_003638 [Apatococcus fuscideae]|uniref:Fungal lipase-type domain-containing protein n=1 Tax=Apatococcus fuscideae TaxID=2026836 RepID=A0AAW1T7H7_9CHLO